MITNHTPQVRAPYAAGLASTPHLHEGKLGKLNAAGEIELATSADDAMGIICDPDACITAAAGNATSATLVFLKFSGIIQVQLGSTENVTIGTKLGYAEGGVFSATESDPLAMAMESATDSVSGQMVNAILL